MSKLGEFGLKGHSGLNVCGKFHVSASYDSNGKVFVSVQDSDFGLTWKRVSIKKANPKAIIKCSMCEKPAVSLDHFWPYHSEMCRCEEHFGKPYKPVQKISNKNNIIDKKNEK